MRIHFVTGRLAEHALRAQLAALAPAAGFEYSVDVLPITVAALMSPAWVAKHVAVPAEAQRVILPGYCEGDLAPITALAPQAKVERGPRDLRQLPEFFGQTTRAAEYGAYDIEILAEINHAPRLPLEEIVRQANQLAAAGADLIDIGCDPGEPWPRVGECVTALKAEGLRISIDSLNPREIGPAVQAGAELVLSVNATNREATLDWGCEVVVIPDDFATLGGLDETIDFLASRNVRLRIDPILEPIGFGFAASLARYLEVRRRYPDAEMLMGIGNLTELTDVDSAGVNALLLGFCQEVGVRSVLTTQVINWARTSVQECDLARRLMHYAITQRVPPKRLEPKLVTLRDPKLYPLAPGQLDELAAQIRDHNYRVYADAGQVHLVTTGVHLADQDPFVVFEQLLAAQPKNLDASHAFYLGFEMAKALTALTLGKQYTQDESLDWGYLTKAEKSHRLASRRSETERGA
jgi:dihydropteroate synthase-like protein